MCMYCILHFNLFNLFACVITFKSPQNPRLRPNLKHLQNSCGKKIYYFRRHQENDFFPQTILTSVTPSAISLCSCSDKSGILSESLLSPVSFIALRLSAVHKSFVVRPYISIDSTGSEFGADKEHYI